MVAVGRLMLAGNIAYISAILVHWAVGYDNLMHLVTAYAGLALLWLGGLASYGHLAAPAPRLVESWQRKLSQAEV